MRVVAIVVCNIRETEDIQTSLSTAASCYRKWGFQGCTIDGKENGKGNDTSCDKEDHHRSEIAQEEVSILSQ
jgi:hypothetical protein